MMTVTVRVVPQDQQLTELLDAALQRVEQAIKGGNPTAIEAAKDAYYELRRDVEQFERARSITQ